MKNDVSFIIDGRLSLFEHQSTLNQNMPLRGFLYFARHFVKKVKQYSEKMERDSAINKAVDKCIENNILKKILIKNRAEVVDMLLTEYNLEKVIGLMQDELEDMKLQHEQEMMEFETKLKQEQEEKQELLRQLEKLKGK